jgi:hypothetical protein
MHAGWWATAHKIEGMRSGVGGGLTQGGGTVEKFPCYYPNL